MCSTTRHQPGEHRGSSLRHNLLVGAGIVIAACSDVGITNNQPSAPTQQRPIDGYGNIRLGTSFMDAIGSLGRDLFNSLDVSRCVRDLPIAGCLLTPSVDGRPFEMREGIPYTLSLSFNRDDRLTDIGLGYAREGGISQADCLRIYERTLDWATREHGAFHVRQEPPEPTVRRQSRRTSAGNTYEVGFMREQSFVTAVSRTVSGRMDASRARGSIYDWDDQRFVTLLSSFIVVDGNPNCEVRLSFQEPQSVARAAIRE